MTTLECVSCDVSIMTVVRSTIQPQSFQKENQKHFWLIGHSTTQPQWSLFNKSLAIPWDWFTLWYQCWEINHSTKKASRVTWNSWLFGAKSITQPYRSPIIEFDFVVVTDSLSGNELLLNQLHCGWVVDYTLNHYLFWFSFQMSVVEWLISQQCYWIQHSCGWLVDIKQWQWRKDTWYDIVLCVLLEY